MCTSISFKAKDHYFGRNLDLEYSYNEAVTITPRKYPFQFREAKTIRNHFAIIGMATIVDDYPLYYDATNEYGLSIAGLNFPGNAVYHPIADSKDNITPFEFIPWILTQCKTVQEAALLLNKINFVDIPFNSEYPLTPLHFMISDRKESLVVEPTKDGVQIYKNDIGVLTNNPPYPYHMYNLCNYLNITSCEPVARFSDQIELTPYSRGMGGIGLPGDLSSASRFVRATFTKLNSVCGCSETESVNQFFHILNSVSQTKGCAQVGNKYEFTLYSSCCNTDKCVYYYQTYNNSQLTAVGMRREYLDGDKLIAYPLRKTGEVFCEN